MPWDGSGNYSPPNPPVFPAVPGTVITASYFNQVIQDLAQGITNTLAKDGQSTPTASIPLHGKRLTDLGDPVADQDAATKHWVGIQTAASAVYHTLEQFGGKADWNGVTGTDNYPALMLAIAAGLRWTNPTSDVTGSWPHTPEIRCGLGAYYFSQMPDLKCAVRLIGQSSGMDDFSYGTTFVVAAGAKGPTVNSRNTEAGGTVAATTSAMGSYFKGISFYSLGGGTSFTGANISGNTYGMWLRAPAVLEDVAIIGFGGNQLQVVGSTGAGGALEGNANGWTCKGKVMLKGPAASGHGLFVKGSDTNVGSIEDLQIRMAGLCGLFEDNTLGSSYSTVQVDDWNGQRNVAGSIGGCSYGGRYYLLIDPTAGIGAATTPGTNSGIWCPVNDNAPGASFFPAWSALGNYAVAMPVFITGNSSSTTIQNLYTESGWSHIDGGAGGTGANVWGGSGATRLTKRSRGVSTQGGLINAINNQRGWAQVVSYAAADPGFAKFGSSLVNVLGGDDSTDMENGVLHRVTAAAEGINYVVRHTGTDLIKEAGVSAPRQPYWRQTGKNTLRVYGRGVYQPYRTELPGFFLGNEGDYAGTNTRELSYNTTFPVAGGPYGKGDIIFNSDPGPGKPTFWQCVSAGSPGLWVAGEVEPFQSGAAGSALTGTTAETVLATLTVPGYVLGANGSLDVDALWTMTNNANAKTLRARLGGLAGWAFWSQSITTFNTARGAGRMQNRNSPLSQVSFAGVSFGGQASPVLTATVDTTASQTVVITGQLANAADSLTLESYTVRITPGV